MPFKLPALSRHYRKRPQTRLPSSSPGGQQEKGGGMAAGHPSIIPRSVLGRRRLACGHRTMPGVPLCKSHKCQQCGTPVDGRGAYGLHCRKSVGWHPCYSAVNDLIKRSLGLAKISVHGSLWESADQMRRGLMGLQLCPGGVVRFWYGMPFVPIPLTWLLGEQGLWPIRQKRGRRHNTPS